MHLLNDAERLLAYVFLFASMLSVGMQTGAGEFRSLFAAKGFLLRSLAANFVVVPAVGIALGLFLPLERPTAAALVLLACSPGGLSAIQFTAKLKGRASHAAALMFFLSVSAVFISPLLMRLFVPRNIEIVVPAAKALGFITVLLLLPLCVGMLSLRSNPKRARSLSKLFALIGTIAFVAFMVATGNMRRIATGEIGWVAVGALLLFLVASMVVGWMLGGPAREMRQMLATATSMRNAILCIAIVHSSAPQNPVLTPLVAFSLLMVPLNTLLNVYANVHAKRLASRAGSDRDPGEVTEA